MQTNTKRPSMSGLLVFKPIAWILIIMGSWLTRCCCVDTNDAEPTCGVSPSDHPCGDWECACCVHNTNILDNTNQQNNTKID
jgi:hypothetical protein